MTTGRRAALVAAREAKLQNVNPALIQIYREIEARTGFSLPVNSGHRNPVLNRKVGGANKSQHLSGNALDLDVNHLSKEDRNKVIRAASELGIGGIGVYNTAIHIDTGSRRFWGPTYKGASLPAWADPEIYRHAPDVFREKFKNNPDRIQLASANGTVVRTSLPPPGNTEEANEEAKGTFDPDARFAMKHLQEKGFTKEQAAGIVGNLLAESNLDTSATGDAGTAFGIAQWRGPRLAALQKFAEERGAEVTDIEVQLDFLVEELDTTEKFAGDALRKAVTAEEAAVAVIHFERPQGYSRTNPRSSLATEKRIRAAKRYAGLLPHQSSTPALNGRGGPADVQSSVSLFLEDPGEFVPTEAERGDPETPSITQGIYDAFALENTLAHILEFRPEAAPDPNYKLDFNNVENTLKELELDPKRYSERFIGVQSEAQFQDRLQAIQEDSEREQRLSELGLTGSVLRIGAAILDPPVIAAEVLTAGVATGALLGPKAGRVGRVVAGAIGGAAGGAAAETAAATFNPNQDETDILLGALFGAGVGGVVGALAQNPNTVKEAIELQRITDDALQETAEDVFGKSSVGAAQAAGRTDEFLNETALKSIQDDDIAPSFAAQIRFDLASQLGSSKNPLTRALLGSLTRDAAGKADGSIVRFSTSEDQERLFQEWQVAYKQTLRAAEREYLKDHAGQGSRAELSQRLFEDADEYIRSTDPAKKGNVHPSVARVGDKIAEIQEEIRQMAQNPFKREGGEGRAVHGFENVGPNKNYLQRVFDSKKVDDIRQTYGDDAVQEIIFNSMRVAAPSDIPIDAIERAAKAFARAVTRRAAGLTDEASRPLSSNSLEELEEILITEGRLNKEEAKSILEKYRAPSEAQSGPSQGKHRSVLDENVSITARDKTGTQTVQLSIRDLIVTDANYLFNRYVRQMSGHIALARTRIYHPKTNELLIDGITNQSEFDQVLRRIDEHAADTGVSQSQRDKDMTNAKFVYDYLVGRPAFDSDGNFATGARLVGKFNFARIMNQVGFAQVPEVSGIISTVGLKAVMKHVPAFKRIINSSGEEILQNGLARDLENWAVAGVDRLLRDDRVRLDELGGSPTSLDRGSSVNHIEYRLNQLGHITADISGMTVVNNALQRLSSVSFVQHFVDLARKGGNVGKARLNQFGLDDEMAERIMKELRDESNMVLVDGPVTGKKLSRFFIDRWKDKEAAERFKQTVFRATRQMIQQNDIGQFHRIMSGPAASLILQFRRFAIAAYTNNLLYNVNLTRQGDMSGVVYFLLSSMLSGAVWAAQTHVRAIGRDDRDEYLEKRLSPDSIAKASFARSGYSSILPIIYDTLPINNALGHQPQFDFRSSGSASDALFGNPTADLLNGLNTAIGSTIRPFADDRQISKKEAESIARVIPFGNSIPALLFLNRLTDGLETNPPRNP